MTTAIEVVSPPSLDELRDTINREHGLAHEAASATIEHALRCGEAILEARKTCRWGEWGKFLKSLNFSAPTVQRYMLLARYKEIVGESPSIVAALRAIRDEDHRPLDPLAEGHTKRPVRWIEDAKRLHASGATIKEIAEICHVPPTAAAYYVDPEYRARRISDAAEQSARRRQERKTQALAKQAAAAKKIGGGISDCYSRIRLAAEALDALARDGSAQETRVRANAALNSIYRAQDEIVALLGAT